jgi:hypothetical protein
MYLKLKKAQNEKYFKRIQLKKGREIRAHFAAPEIGN